MRGARPAHRAMEAWEARMDERGRVYYYCEATGSWCWPEGSPSPAPAPATAPTATAPTALGRGEVREDPAQAWEQRRDAASGTPYIFNRATGEAHWGRIRGAGEAGEVAGRSEARPSSTAATEEDWLEAYTPRGQRYYVALASRATSWSPPDPGAGSVVHLPPPPEGEAEPHPEHWRLLYEAELQRHCQRKAAGLPVPASPPPESRQSELPPPPALPPPTAAVTAPSAPPPGAATPPPPPPPPASKPRAPSFHPSLMMAFDPEDSTGGAEETVMNRLPSRRR